MSAVYLVTFSHAERSSVNSRQEFGELVAESFGRGAVERWAVCREPHSEEGWHFHCAIKLRRSLRFITAKRKLQAKDIVVHFARPEGSGGYVASQYVIPAPL